MVFSDDPLNEKDPYDYYYRYFDNYLDIQVSISIYKSYSRLASPKLSLTADKPYLVFYFTQRHWKVKNWRLPRLGKISFSLDRFEGFSGHKKKQCMFSNSTHSIETYGKDWFVVEII